MTYVPPPYSPPTAALGDPTNVMGRRVVAHIIDLILLGVIVGVLFFATADKIKNVPTGFCTDSQFSSQRARSCVQIGNTAYQYDSGRTGAGIVLGVGYWTLVGMIEGASGAFLGKRILGLRVVNANGDVPGPGRGALRGVLMVIDSTFCFLIGLITALVTHPHRRVGDLAAGTYVVGKDSMGRPIPTTTSSYIPYAPPPQQSAPATTGGGFAPGTYGTSLPPSASTPPAEQQPGWAAPPADQQPGWAAPAPSQPTWGTAPQPAPQPDPQPQAPQPPQPPQPQWDAARNAWIVWEPGRGQWLQWDAATSQWRPIS